jgi:uncharacterized protein YuzE
MPRREYDPEADALYIHLREAAYDHGFDVDAQRRVDYGKDGLPVGVELLRVSEGVKLDGLPERATIEQVLRELGLGATCAPEDPPPSRPT